MANCKNCGELLTEGNQFCTECGASVDQAPPSATLAGVRSEAAPGGSSFTEGASGAGRRPLTGKAKLMAVAVLITALVVVLIVVVTSSSGGGRGSSTPAGAVSGLANALLSGNAAGSCRYVPPNVQSQCQSAVNNASPGNVSGHISIAGTVTHGDEALVAVTGSLCGVARSGPPCQSNSDPATGMPSNGTSFDEAFSAAVSEANTSGSSPLSPVPCIEISGAWYVDLG